MKKGKSNKNKTTERKKEKNKQWKEILKFVKWLDYQIYIFIIQWPVNFIFIISMVFHPLTYMIWIYQYHIPKKQECYVQICKGNRQQKLYLRMNSLSLLKIILVNFMQWNCSKIITIKIYVYQFEWLSDWVSECLRIKDVQMNRYFKLFPFQSIRKNLYCLTI